VRPRPLPAEQGLRAELALARVRFEESGRQLRQAVTLRAGLVKAARRHPWVPVAAAFLVGFLWGHEGRGGTRAAR
jgi:hypothetical protein